MENYLEEFLECPICRDYFTLPIRICAIGHSVCSKCMKILDKCPLCQNEFTNIRNIILEGFAKKMKYPCENKDDGCNEMLSYDGRKNHQLTCKFRKFRANCIVSGCNFFGDAKALKAHWLTKKNNQNNFIKIYEGRFEGSLKLEKMHRTSLIESFDQLFWFKRKIFKKNITFLIQFVGKVEEADRYWYQIEIENVNVKRNKITISDNCKSLNLSDEEIFVDEDCCSINLSCLKQFIHDGCINYTATVFKKDEAELLLEQRENLTEGSANLPFQTVSI